MKHTSYKKSVFKSASQVAHLTYQIGETDILREKSKAINPKEIKSQKIQLLVSKLKNILSEYKKLTGKGRGIAAVQIGIPLQIAVLVINDKPFTIINPKIIDRSKTLISYPEICMSANPIIAKVIRPQWVKVTYFDEFGNQKIWDKKNEKLPNRVLQHEIDHMEGIINIDLVTSRDLILDSDPNYFKNAKFVKIHRTKKHL